MCAELGGQAVRAPPTSKRCRKGVSPKSEHGLLSEPGLQSPLPSTDSDTDMLRSWPDIQAMGYQLEDAKPNTFSSSGHLVNYPGACDVSY